MSTAKTLLASIVAGAVLCADAAVFEEVVLAGIDDDVPRTFQDSVGIYHWGGQKTNGVASGIRAILALNARVARITLSPRMGMDYNTDTKCIEDFRLAGVLDDDELRSALADPRLQVLIMTVYDGTGFGDCMTHSYFSPGFYSHVNTARMVQEYSDFVYRLYESFNGSGKRFILSNWEGDNAVYCGMAYPYVMFSSFREQCHKVYGRNYAGNHSPADSIEGMVLWMKARYLGVMLGKERARANKLTGVDVFVAPEISSVHMLKSRGYPSVLHDVLTRAPFDYVSYSAYESLGKTDPASALKADLETIRSIAGASPIILGEIGFPRSVYAERLIDVAARVTQTALESGVSYIIHWNLYDQDTASDFGLYDVDGHATNLETYYVRMYSELRKRRSPREPGRGCAEPQ